MASLTLYPVNAETKNDFFFLEIKQQTLLALITHVTVKGKKSILIL